MAAVTSETTITASPTEVWQLLGEGFDRLHEWFDGARRTEMQTEPPHGPGSVRLVGSGPMTVREEIDAWEPEERLGYRITGLGPGVTEMRSDWVLLGRPDGTTVAKVTTSWQMRGGRLGLLVRPVYAHLLSRAGTQLTSGLKQAVETGSPG